MSYYAASSTPHREDPYPPIQPVQPLAIGPLVEPFYIVPHSILCELLRGRAITAMPQTTPPQPYMLGMLSGQQHAGALPTSVQGPFAPYNASQGPLQSSLLSVLDITQQTGAHFSGYGLESALPASNAYYPSPAQPWIPSFTSTDPFPQHPNNVTMDQMPSHILPATAFTQDGPQFPHPYPVHAPPAFAQSAREAERPHAYRAPGDPSLRVFACASCHRSKKKCGQERPCRRCTECSLPCVDRDRDRAPRRAREGVGAVDFALHDDARAPFTEETAGVFAGADSSLGAMVSFGRLPHVEASGSRFYAD